MSESQPILPDQNSFGPTGLQNYFLWMRERNKFILSMGCERVLLYKRRYSGQRCPLWDSVRGTSAQHSDHICFGTGWISESANQIGPDAGAPYYGFFQSVEIEISLLSGGPEDLALTDYGQQRIYKPHSWTLWEPLLTSGDMIVRRNNQRYFISEVFPRRWKHFVTHQDFEMSEIERGSIVYELSSGL